LKSSINLKRNNMARIGNFVADTDVTKDDKLVGTDIGGASKNYRLEDVSRFIKNTNAAGIAAQFTYQFKANTTRPNGSMSATFSVVGSLQFSKLTAVEVNKFIFGSNESSENLLGLIAAKDVLIIDVENQNNFGLYTAGTPTKDSTHTNFYDISLSDVQNSNGSLTNDKFYAIIVFGGGGGDKTHELAFSTSTFEDADGNDTEEALSGVTMKYFDFSHNLGKNPSITVTEAGSPDVKAFVPVKYINNNKVRVYFTGKTNGKVYAN